MNNQENTLKLTHFNTNKIYVQLFDILCRKHSVIFSLGFFFWDINFNGNQIQF